MEKRRIILVLSMLFITSLIFLAVLARGAPDLVIATDSENDVEYVKVSSTGYEQTIVSTQPSVDICELTYSYHAPIFSVGLKLKATPELKQGMMYMIKVFYTAKSEDGLLTVTGDASAMFGSNDGSSTDTIAIFTYESGDTNGELDVLESKIEENMIYWEFNLTGTIARTAFDGSINIDVVNSEAESYYIINSQVEYYHDQLDDQSGGSESDESDLETDTGSLRFYFGPELVFLTLLLPVVIRRFTSNKRSSRRDFML